MKLSEIALLARAILRTMIDSEQTTEIHRAEELTGRRRFREVLDTLPRTAEGRALLADRPELCSAQVDYDALRALPATSLGGAYVGHLDGYGLTADAQALPTRHIDDPDLAYVIRRFRQTHDVWHALTGLGTAGHEEVIIHAFSWGQLRLPVSALVVSLGTLKHIVGEGRWKALRYGLAEAYRHGRDAAPLMPVYWERYWAEPLDDVRNRYNVRPCTPALFAA